MRTAENCSYKNKVRKLTFHFIPSSESSAYLKQIKGILSAVKKYRILYFFTSDEYDFYVFTVANRGCFDNFWLDFFQKRS